jgi:predicted TIM-barrel fold metal-dependent hydrolase
MGFNTDHDDAIKVAQMAKTKKDATIYLEISHVEASTIVKAIKTVGSDRVVFGTDATYYGRTHYDTYLDTLQTVKKSVSPSEFQQFIHGNAIELFHLTETKANQSTGK